MIALGAAPICRGTAIAASTFGATVRSPPSTPTAAGSALRDAAAFLNAQARDGSGRSRYPRR
jgi:hypothetical protein